MEYPPFKPSRDLTDLLMPKGIEEKRLPPRIETDETRDYAEVIRDCFGQRIMRYTYNLGHTQVAIKGDLRLKIISNKRFTEKFKKGLYKRLGKSPDPIIQRLAEEFYQWAQKNPSRPNGIIYETDQEGNLYLNCSVLKKRGEEAMEEENKKPTQEQAKVLWPPCRDS